MDELARKDRNFYIRMLVEKEGQSHETVAEFYNITVEEVIEAVKEVKGWNLNSSSM